MSFKKHFLSTIREEDGMDSPTLDDMLKRRSLRPRPKVDVDIPEDMSETKIKKAKKEAVASNPMMLPGTKKKIEASNSGVINGYIELFSKLPDRKTLGDIALMGAERIGWYEKSHNQIMDMFGLEGIQAALAENNLKLFGPNIHDAMRFIALLAAFSPRNDVKTNAAYATQVFAAWLEGKPDDEDDPIPSKTSDEAHIKRLIKQELGSAIAGGGNKKGMKAWVNNAVLVFQRDSEDFISDLEQQLKGEDVYPLFGVEGDPEEKKVTDIKGSFKIESFMRNLMGDSARVTIDTWMEYLSDFFPGSVGNFKSYAVYETLIREVADDLGWKPAEVQETVWSVMKAVVDASSPTEITKARQMGGPTHELDELDEDLSKEIEKINNSNKSPEKKAKERQKLRSKFMAKNPSERAKDIAAHYLYGVNEKQLRSEGVPEDEIRKRKEEAKEKMGGVGVNMAEVESFMEFMTVVPDFETMLQDEGVKPYVEKIRGWYERRVERSDEKRDRENLKASERRSQAISQAQQSLKTGSGIESIGRFGEFGDDTIWRRASKVEYNKSVRILDATLVNPPRKISPSTIRKRNARKAEYAFGMNPHALKKAVDAGKITKMKEFRDALFKGPFAEGGLMKTEIFVDPHSPSLDVLTKEFNEIRQWLSRADSDRESIEELLRVRGKKRRAAMSQKLSSAQARPTFNIWAQQSEDSVLVLKNVVWIESTVEKLEPEEVKAAEQPEVEQPEQSKKPKMPRFQAKITVYSEDVKGARSKPRGIDALRPEERQPAGVPHPVFQEKAKETREENMQKSASRQAKKIMNVYDDPIPERRPKPKPGMRRVRNPDGSEV